jgi:uncharacterized protein (TIGR00290 family)
MRTRAGISWSGGKDSCLAWLRAREQGFEVDTFLTMCEPDGLSKSHALPPALLAAQVCAAGAVWHEARSAPGEYAQVFDAQLRRLRAEGHSHMIFGDIDLQPHRDWLEPACSRAGLVAVFPLWGEARIDVAREALARGVRARLVCVDTRWLDPSFCGLDYDHELIERLSAGVCPCGENGEFHTFVFNAPGFSHALPIRNGEQQRVVSAPPLAPTELVLQTLVLER